MLEDAIDTPIRDEDEACSASFSKSERTEDKKHPPEFPFASKCLSPVKSNNANNVMDYAIDGLSNLVEPARMQSKPLTADFGPKKNIECAKAYKINDLGWTNSLLQ
ncbi:hypothetical protein HDU96_005401, partial [Phlyctochytrium bullatum]